MKSDLRNLVFAQEAFHDSSKRYSSDLRELGFKHSTGTVPPQFETLGESGWIATNGHTQLKYPCHIYVGARPSNVPESIDEAEPWCTPEYAWYDDRRMGAPLALGFIIMMIGMTLTSVIAFKRPDGRKNWPAIGQGVLTWLTFVTVVGIGSCGASGMLLASLPPFLLAAVIFGTALTRRIRSSA